MKTNSFRKRLQSRYQVLSEEENLEDVESDESTDLQRGSSHPENWQTDIQSGKSSEEIRQEANALSQILLDWQAQVLQAEDYFKELTANSDKYLHLYTPILIKGLSREKLETISEICQKFARLATIV